MSFSSVNLPSFSLNCSTRSRWLMLNKGERAPSRKDEVKDSMYEKIMHEIWCNANRISSHAPYNLLQLFPFPLLFEFTRSFFRSSQVFIITAVIVMNIRIFIRLVDVIGVGSSPRTVGRRWRSVITLIDFSMKLRLRRRWLLLRFRLVSFEAELASGKCAASWLCHGEKMREACAACWVLSEDK